MPVKRKATAAQKGKTVGEKMAERAPSPVVEESESQSAAQSQSSHSVPILEEREGASAPAPAPAPPAPPPDASGQDVVKSWKIPCICIVNRLTKDIAYAMF